MDTKPWWQSVGVWGGVLAVLAPAIGAITGMTFSSQDMASAAQAFTSIGTAVSMVISAVGGLVAIYGRVRATKQVGS